MKVELEAPEFLLIHILPLPLHGDLLEEAYTYKKRIISFGQTLHYNS